MSTKNTISIAVVIAIAVLFVSSNTFVNPLLAKTHKDKSSETDKNLAQSNEQSNKNKDKGSGDSSNTSGSGDSSNTSGSGDSSNTSGSGDSSDSNSNPTKTTDNTSPSDNAQNNYDKFQKCLFDADSTKGFATKQEIKDCFNPLFNIQTGDSTLTPSSS
ncbi:MAG: hypothetical protein ACTHKK_00705 [Candidatus Nitrosocosmicus sp.]